MATRSKGKHVAELHRIYLEKRGRSYCNPGLLEGGWKVLFP